jgi:hypothetical protein
MCYSADCDLKDDICVLYSVDQNVFGALGDSARHKLLFSTLHQSELLSFFPVSFASAFR